MKLKFKNQDFQTAAVSAVCDLFLGQEKHRSTFSVTHGEQLSLVQNDFGIGNALLIGDSDLLANMRAVQKQNNLPQTDNLEGNHFCIEMETGTGKTYVYTKTIYELHRRYGFTKFIVVVPSVAIREGVYKSLQITQEHFGLAYDNAPCRFFIYNSQKLSDVRQFATSANIEIMIINIDAFKKAQNIINQAQDKLNGETAMRYIQDCRPIVIIDEPQSVDNTPKAKEAIASLNPLCALRYSATHREKVNLLYRLTPVDAYQMGLVKQICVSSNQVDGDFNRPYIRLVSVTNDGGFKAKVELDAQAKGGKVTRKTVTLTSSDGSLFLKSGERELYADYVLTGIDCTPGYEAIEFANGQTLPLGKSMGDIDENIIKRAQIRRTIEVHLDKERRYLQRGIKVLSLFFIDEVKKYRSDNSQFIIHNSQLNSTPGMYTQIFEECYDELIRLPKYEAVRKFWHGDNYELCITNYSLIHGGYFSQDKKGRYKDTRGDTLDDHDTYNTIMRDKEWLLSFECPLRFIFSHSALKEGWDNPNVFQVCTLIEQKSAFTCRQKIGRGLRLCVNQDGERIEDREINLLHVMANESFAEFANTLQKEIEQETGVKFGVLEIGLFANLIYTEERKEEKTVDHADAKLIMDYMTEHGFVDNSGKPTEAAKAAVVERTIPLPIQLETAKEGIAKAIAADTTVKVEHIIGQQYTETITLERTIDYDDAKELIEHFDNKGYISKTGKVNDTMKNALLNGTLDLPSKFEAARERLQTIISQTAKALPIRDASRDVTVRLIKEVITESPEFVELWSKIKQKTTYRVAVDSAELIRRCAEELSAAPPIPKAHILLQTADIHIMREGVTHTEREMRMMSLRNSYASLPDALAVIGDQTLTKRSTVLEILKESGRLGDFTANPQLFIESCVEIIRNNRRELAIDGIRYMKLDGEEYYLQEMFDSAELIANLDKNALPVQHSVYDHIIYDSDTIERPFAVSLDSDPDVRMFFKIPSKFKVETPIGTYNPDWAVYLEQDGTKKLFFVLETKGSTNRLGLRGTEELKIICGRAHFEALGTCYQVTNSWNRVRASAVEG